MVASPRMVSPFGEPASSLEIAGTPLAEWQEELLRSSRLQPVQVSSAEDIRDAQPHVVLSGDLFFTRRVLRSFLKRWRNRTEAVQVAIPEDSVLLESMGTLQRYRSQGGLAGFDLYGVPGGSSLRFGGRPDQGRPSPDPAPRLLPVTFREKVLELPMPEHVVGQSRWVHAITSSACLHVEHWIHLLQANRLAIQVRWIDRIVRSPIWALGLGLRALVPWPGHGGLLWRALGVANQIGSGVDVHPTARIEGAILEPGVKVGAFALVRASVVGAGTVIEDRATVAYSSIGPRSFVSKYTLVYASAALADANLGTSMQMCLAGRGVALTPRATPIDVVPGGQIRVLFDGQLVPVDLPVLGSCFGHHCFLGADVFLAPGREVPNGVVIGPRPDRVLVRVPDDLKAGRRYWIEDGQLRSARQGT